MSLIARSRVARLLVIVAAAALALVVVPSGRAEAAGTPCQRTFSSGPIDLPIPDDGNVTASIDVPEDGLVVSDVDVAVDLHHTFPSDLELSLASFNDPFMVRATNQLFVRQLAGGIEDSILGTVFDDAATLPISWGSAPFTGRFLPSRPLAIHNGFTGGAYALTVFDERVGDTGTLNDWSITLTYASCDVDGDGVEDHADSCLGVAAATPSGCPPASRAISASHRASAFRGAISSPVSACRGGREVTIMRARPGTDAKVGTTRTRSDGSYRLVRAKKRGTYYAASARAVVPDVAECAPVRSRSFRVR